MSRQLESQDFAQLALAQYLGVDPAALEPAHDLERDWGICRLDLVLIALRLEDLEQIAVPFDQLADVTTVADLSRLFRGWLGVRIRELDIRAGQYARVA